MAERRNGSLPDTGQRRRRVDILERQEEFRLQRDKTLLLLGVVGVMVVTFVALFIGVKSDGLALAALTLFGGLLGAPTVLRLDERRQRNGAER